MSVPEYEYESLLARARFYRWYLGRLGSDSESVVRQNVRDRLCSLSKNELTPAERELVDEVVELLGDRRLSRWDAQQLEFLFFGSSPSPTPPA